MKIWHFEITCREGQVSVLEYQDDIVRPLKNNGEETWPLTEDFWTWFKDKIRYNGEPISFIVIGEAADTLIPPDEFRLAAHNTCYQPLGEGEAYTAYPELSEAPQLSQAHLESPSDAFPAQPTPQPGTLQDYFRRKTQAYQKDS